MRLYNNKDLVIRDTVVKFALRQYKKSLGLLVALTMLWTVPAGAESSKPGDAKPEAKAGAGELAKKLNNPISDLVSVPFQFNWAQGVGPDDDTRFILNIQPVMPFDISKDWNMITRVILPYIGQPPLTVGGSAASGFGDALMSFFFSPKASKPIWGIGPVISAPSGNVPTLGTGKWSAGPTIVILQQTKGFTYGILANQIWSFAGNANRNDVSQMFLQPFFAYTTPKLVTYTINSETTVNWEADSGQQVTAPINFMLTKLASFGPIPAAYQIGLGYYVEAPEGGPDWQLRAAVTLMLPKK